MAFKEFTEYDTVFKDKVTLRPKGNIYLRNAVLNSLDSDTTTDFVTLLFETETNKLGIKFTTKKDRRLSKEPAGVSINIRPLLNYYEFKLTKKHTLEVTIRKDMFIIDLSVLKAGKS